MAFLGPVAETDDEVGRTLEVVGDFLQCLAGDVRHTRIARGKKCAQHFEMIGVEQELPHQRLAEVAVRTLDEQDVAEGGRIAQIGEIVSRAALALDLARKPQPELGLTDQVERGVGKRDILFEHGRMAAPLGHAVTEDQRIVAHAQEPFEKCGLIDRRGRGRHHMCPTSAGMSKKVG